MCASLRAPVRASSLVTVRLHLCVRMFVRGVCPCANISVWSACACARVRVFVCACDPQLVLLHTGARAVTCMISEKEHASLSRILRCVSPDTLALTV